MKKGWYCPPLCTLVIGLSIYAIFSLFPFSNLTIAWCDMKQQVIPLLIDFKQILSGSADFFLNFQNAGGMSFLGPFFFFLSSPFSFLVAFVSAENVYMLVNVLVLLKMMVASLTAGIFFRTCYPSLGLAQSTALSVMYAFSGYTMLYFQNIVWLDMMYLFPLLLLGLYQIATKGKASLFFFSLCAAIIIQFYLTYMVLLYTLFAAVIYAYFCFPEKPRRQTLFRFAAATAAAFLVTAAVWVPLLCQYFSSARPIGLLDSLLSGGLWARWETTVVTVICTMMIFAAVPMLFFLPRKHFERPAASLLLFFLMLLPIGLEPINKMWHTGSYQAFPSRYGFITVLCGLIVAAEVLSRLNCCDAQEEKKPDPAMKGRSVFLPCFVFIIAALAVLGGILLASEQEALTVYMRRLWIDRSFLKVFLQFALIVLVVYFLLMALYRLRLLRRKAFTVFLCAVTVCESMFSGGIFLGYAGNDVTFNKEVLDLSGKIEDDSLYRVKLAKKYFDVNLMGSLNYGSVNHYTSFTDADYISTMKKLGYSSYWMESSSVGGTLFSDFLLGHQYTIDGIGTLSGDENLVYSNNRFVLLKNNDSAPIGIVADGWETVEKDGIPLSQTERLPQQEAIFEALFQTTDSLFETYEPDNLANLTLNYDTVYSYRRVNDLLTGILYYKIDVKGTQTLYFDCFNEISVRLREVINGGCNIYVDGIPIETEYPTQKNNGILELGTFTDQSVLVEIELLKDVNARSFGVYGLKHEVLEKHLDTLQAAELSQVGNTFTGSAVASGEGQYLFLSVPYGSGYTAHVNGEKAEFCRVFDDFLAVKLQKGENTITVSYLPPGVIPGLIISGLSILSILLLLWWKKKHSLEKWQHRLSGPTAFLVVVAFYIAVFMVNLFPLLVRLIGVLKSF